MRAGLWLGMVGLCISMAATAQGQVRHQTVAEGGASDWTHEKSGIVLPGRLLGLERGAVQDATGGGELDVFARYEGGTGTDYVTVYLYRPAIMSVPLWFDRAHMAVRVFQHVGAAKPAVTFAPTGSETASAMRVSYAMPGGAAATVLALVPAGEWLLKIRLTGPGSSEDVEGKVDQVLATIGLPDGPDAPAAAEVQPCATPLQFQPAQALKPDGAKVLLLAMTALARNEAAATEVWCRGGEQGRLWGLYRKADTTSGYVLTIGDSGRVLQVDAAPPLEQGKATDFSLSFVDMGEIHQFPQLSALPSPQQAVALADELEPVARISRDSRKIDLALDEMADQDGGSGT